MEKIRTILHLLSQNKYNTDSSDIMEHLPTLYKYASECDSVFETGVRGCVSSWAFYYGLVNNRTTDVKKRMFLNDVSPCNIRDLLKINEEFQVEIKYEWKNNLLLDMNETYDITFIDTWHVYGQLKRELVKFSTTTNKYIIMHDTTVDEIYGESIRCKSDVRRQQIESGFPIEEITRGLWPAVVEFLEQNPEWYIKERFTNNNGLTILARKE
jgi:hypothetical protein